MISIVSFCTPGVWNRTRDVVMLESKDGQRRGLSEREFLRHERGLNGGGAKVVLQSLKMSRATYVASFPSKETDNMDGRYYLPKVGYIGGVYHRFLNIGR
jgi:hypothetical protein